MAKVQSKRLRQRGTICEERTLSEPEMLTPTRAPEEVVLGGPSRRAHVVGPKQARSAGPERWDTSYRAAIASLQEVDEPLPLPPDEEIVDHELIMALLPLWLHDVAGFFSKRESWRLPESTDKDIVLELRKPFPVKQPKGYRTPPALNAVMKEAIDKYLAAGFIYRMHAEGAAPAILVLKGERTSHRPEDWRFCVDY